MSSKIRKTGIPLLLLGLGGLLLIASDAHDAAGRPPGLSKAVEEAAKIMGKAKALAM